MMNAKAFYAGIRGKMFGGGLSQEQVDSINAIIEQFNEYKGLDYRHLAYVMATVYHETAGTMRPIEEYGKGGKRPYARKWKMGAGPNKRVAYTYPDKLYYGRGFVQVTWYENYERLSKLNSKGWDFLHYPELLLQPGPSAWACMYGMVKGIYTGKKLTDYINDTKTDFVGARKIINGRDKDELIADYAADFYKYLTAL